MAINFTIDTVLLATQPSGVEFTPPAAVYDQNIDGSYTASLRGYGAVIRATWGGDAAFTDTMDDLRTARNSLVEHEVEFTDPSGTTHTYDVAWPSDPEFRLIPPYLYGAITCTFYQRG